MTTLTATAIISAVDRASAVFARVGAAARAQAGKFAAATAAVNRFGSAAAVGLGAPGALAGALAMRGEYEADKALRVMQSIGEITTEQRKMLERSAFDNAITSAVSAIELIKAQQEFLASGIDPDTAAGMTDTIGKVARANNIIADQVAETGINVANAMSMPMATVEEKIGSLTKSLEFMSVVPNLSTETFEGLRTSMKYAAPVAGALGIRIEELGAALGILADAGFRGEQGGTALRTILARSIALTPAARKEVRAAGIDVDDMYKVNEQRLANMNALAERLRGAGLGQGVNLDKVLAGMNPAKYKTVYAYQDALIKRLMPALKIGRGDAESRGILNKAVGAHVFGAVESFDLEKLFTSVSKMPLQGIKEMFGIQRMSQAIKLREEITKIMKLPSGERITKFRRLADEIERLMPGSIDRRFRPVSEGFAYFIDRTMRALEGLRNSVFNSGVGNDISGFFEGLSRTIERMRRMDPNALKAATYGLAGLAALGPAAIILGTMATALDKIGGILGNKTFRRLAIGGGLVGAFFGEDIMKLFYSPDVLGRGGVDIYGQFLGEGAPILATAEKIKAVFDQLSGATGDIATNAGKIYTELTKLFSIDTSGSMLLDGLALLNTALENMARSIEQIRRFFGGQAPKIEAPSGSSADDAMKAYRMGPGLFYDMLMKLLKEREGDPLKKFNQSGPGAQTPAPPQKVDVEVGGKMTGTFTLTDAMGREIGRLDTSAPLNTGRDMPDMRDTRPWAR